MLVQDNGVEGTRQCFGIGSRHEWNCSRDTVQTGDRIDCGGTRERSIGTLAI